jgi:WD40 repeat protein
LTLAGHTGWILTVSFSPDGRRILSGSWDSTIRIWDAGPLGADAPH